MLRGIRSRWQTLDAQTTGLLAVSCIAWLGASPARVRAIMRDSIGLFCGLRRQIDTNDQKTGIEVEFAALDYPAMMALAII